uniref:Secreted protein n=1 Tax=Caenorhabditis tropicalis TaxID=1561998 RepID=A0A1I7UPV7_9PELO
MLLIVSIASGKPSNSFLDTTHAVINAESTVASTSIAPTTLTVISTNAPTTTKSSPRSIEHLLFWITLKSIVKYAGIVMGTIKVIQVTLQEDVNKA